LLAVLGIASRHILAHGGGQTGCTHEARAWHPLHRQKESLHKIITVVLGMCWTAS